MAQIRRLPVDPPSAETVSRALKLEGFFPEFGVEHCEKLFPRSGVYAFEPGEQLIIQGEPGRDLFVLLAGRVRIRRESDGAAAELALLGPGEIIGEIALLGWGTRTASASAEEPCRAFRLAYEDLGYILGNNLELAAHLRELARKRST